MHLILLHGTIDRHDGLAVLVVALTIVMGSALSSLRDRQRRGRRNDTAHEEPTR
jgi:hypothetical protein